MNTAYLGLGSNVGDRAAHLQFALEALRPVRVSGFYETAPLHYLAQGSFLNCVCEVETERSPWALLDEVRRLEHLRQRERPFPNAPRTLDIDILLYGNFVLRSPRLTIPHPRMGERAFVLAPLAELLPGYGRLLAGLGGQQIWRLGAGGPGD
ncbi:MAG: 2-amino-4-hydroxy-6-hydroxymethyldihydropteridine diphosphokinase [Acidobacteriaceae bacterium]|nr:2-amino-4-hydroxy-6-hydroxymethyldihydropteridine diphosphokinase [Acidobacteriaceae bacterium]